MKKIQSLPLFINLLISLGIGAIAGIFTKPEISDWYYLLDKPLFNPPNLLLGIIWAIIYILMGIAAYLIWTRRRFSRYYTTARNLYFFQLALNFTWSFVFFGLHELLGGAFICTALLISIITNIIYFNRISGNAAWLFLPYLLWISFSCLLNWNIFFLN
ncbi:MAG: TspO/MBR family protein [Sphingobacteriaceae bacterium]